ncbi:alginate O-acetyltransferase AlgX-related protein [Enterobacter ludwigii]|uniref:alginate O-acetyltransferase AlgX-related protein n=1 Tax=Enterobacter ludwigii TaxID=299767 RepID=UPI0035247FEB
MKRYINAFLITAAIGLSVVPAVNIYQGMGAFKNNSQNEMAWFHYSKLYNLDFTLPYMGYVLYKNGISISPENVVIGKDGWLFLGDRHASVMSETRGMKQFNKKRLDNFSEARKSWDKYVREQGGSGYFVSIAPNSHTIFREKMPDWASKNKSSPNIKYLLNEEKNDQTLVDLSLSLKDIKGNSMHPIYYKTDTHWNEFGSWYGYKDLQKKIQASIPDLKWLSSNDISFKSNLKNGGDLSRFIRIQNLLTDIDVRVKIKTSSKIVVTDYKGNTLRVSDTSDRQEDMSKQLIVHTSNALNDKKVLWLRDSFGVALYPYMNATFSTIMQQHYQDVLTNPEYMKKLITEFKPDLVIITVIERNSLSEYFENAPEH